jgi:hypothetical protein
MDTDHRDQLAPLHVGPSAKSWSTPLPCPATAAFYKQCEAGSVIPNPYVAHSRVAARSSA